MKLSVTREETETTLKITVEWSSFDTENFSKVCWLIGIFLVGSGILKFFSMMS